VRPNRVGEVLSFLEVSDRFKSVYRAAYLSDGSRREGDADHAWHMCLFAMLLHGESELEPDLRRVLELCLVHDLVEIGAGDTDAHDAEGQKDKREREERAADELFSLLPEDLGRWLRGLWEEYEEARTPEARFAKAMDRLQALAQNVFGGGRSWRERGVTEEMTRALNEVGALELDPSLAPVFEALLNRARRERSWG
jgi:putative hydrolase of HD superfamily